jgi:hypothetical protein
VRAASTFPEASIRCCASPSTTAFPDDRFDQPLTVLVRAPRAWRGQPVELGDPDGKMVSRVEAPGDRTPLALDVLPDRRTYTLSVPE